MLQVKSITKTVLIVMLTCHSTYSFFVEPLNFVFQSNMIDLATQVFFVFDSSNSFAL